MATATQPQHPEVAEERAQPTAPPGRRSRRSPWPLLGLTVGALVFLFPFYYMVIGALQSEPNSSISGAFPNPAILTAVILTFIGPWNEFLWPFLVTKQLALQPLAVALANFISTVAARQTNPFGATLAGAVVLAIPAVVLFLVFQRRFQASNIGSAIKG